MWKSLGMYTTSVKFGLLKRLLYFQASALTNSCHHTFFLQTKQDFTVTTADSSYNSSSPHHLDVIPFDADFSTQEIFQNDFHLSSLHSSSRIQNIHLHSGLAEI